MVTTPPADSSSNGEGAIGLSKLSEGRRRMLDLVNRLHSTGVQVDIDLPVIAVVGSQSAGKSSLIESISGIALPRAAGTCTRCPTECKLSHSSDPWKCVVSLRLTTDERGQPISPPKNVPFGNPIFDKSEVQERIRRAQRAILSPSTSPQSFLDGDDEDSSDRQMTFSSNCISLQISGDDVADLSFCDLPGLIASVSSGGNTGDINLVKSLIQSYISKPSCIILLTITCETDYENQGAYELAKTNDPHGKRTVGVLTKPDRISTGEEDRWLKFVRNEQEPLVNNWYVMKQPDGKALKQGIAWKTARRQEDEFFSMTSPWNLLEPMYQKYLRTSNLTERLSDILSELISKRLPQIHEELQAELIRTENSLRSLPRAPSDDALLEILNVLHIFVRDLERHLEGTPNEDGLIQSIRPAQRRFKRAIRSTAPDFRPYEAKHAGTMSVNGPDFLNNEEDNEEADNSTLDWYEGAENARVIYIDQVLERATNARTRELPDNYPFVVYSAFISEVIQRWSKPAEDLFQETHRIVSQYVAKLAVQHFKSSGRGELQQRVLLILSEHIKIACERTQRQIDWLIRLERRPFTLNDHYYVDYRDKFMCHYKRGRQRENNGSFTSAIEAFKPGQSSLTETFKPGLGSLNHPIVKVLSGLAEMGIKANATDLAKMLPSDPMEPALQIMASVRAYFQVAYKRFADNVVLAIDHELVLGLREGIETALNTKLGITGKDGAKICKELLQEHPNIASRREELKKRYERLSAASSELVKVEV